jgi:hypothetical protein
MAISENENGSSHGDLVQRVARLEGAVGCRGHQRIWGMGWMMVWLAFAAVNSFRHSGDGSPWRMAWPAGFLVFFAVMYFVRDRREHDLCFGGKR